MRTSRPPRLTSSCAARRGGSKRHRIAQALCARLFGEVQMKRFWPLLIALLLGAQANWSPAFAVTDTPLPTNAFITFNGYDWAWASPCAPSAATDFCAAYPTDLSYQGTLGWGLPTEAEINAAVAAAGGLTGWANLFVFSGAYKSVGGKGFQDFACAATFFTNLTNCDYTDVTSIGDIYNYTGPGAYGPDSYQETFALRQTAVPLPAALPFFASGLGGLGLLRWRRKRKAVAAAAA